MSVFRARRLQSANPVSVSCTVSSIPMGNAGVPGVPGVRALTMGDLMERISVLEKKIASLETNKETSFWLAEAKKATAAENG